MTLLYLHSLAHALLWVCMDNTNCYWVVPLMCVISMQVNAFSQLLLFAELTIASYISYSNITQTL